MVYLNAGCVHQGFLEHVEPHQIQDVITLSALQPVYLTKALINQLLSRNTMSAIVITSSGASVQPMPGIMSYCASKVFSVYFGRALYWELKDRVDVLAWSPGSISTKMIDN